MKFYILYLLFIINYATISADFHFINLNQISDIDKFQTEINFLRTNEQYFAHWSPEWNYDVSKDLIINGLVECYNKISGSKSISIEKYLLLGKISEFQYSLDIDSSYEKAVLNYQKALELNSNDYRAYWFLGAHHSGSGANTSAIENYKKAIKLLKNEPVEFWTSYAMACWMAGMPVNSRYAFDKAARLNDGPTEIEMSLMTSMGKSEISPDLDTTYSYNDLWSSVDEEIPTEKFSLVSKMLGTQLTFDTTWNFQFGNFYNRMAYTIIKPDTLFNNSDLPITYSILLMYYLPDENLTIGEYIKSFVSKYPDKRLMNVALPYENTIAYEIIDPDMYKNIGGGHLQVIGFERDVPDYPGLNLETPKKINSNESENMSFYSIPSTYSRFNNRIFYILMLDTCEDIYKKSVEVFQKKIIDRMFVE